MRFGSHNGWMQTFQKGYGRRISIFGCFFFLLSKHLAVSCLNRNKAEVENPFKQTSLTAKFKKGYRRESSYTPLNCMVQRKIIMRKIHISSNYHSIINVFSKQLIMLMSPSNYQKMSMFPVILTKI